MKWASGDVEARSKLKKSENRTLLKCPKTKPGELCLAFRASHGWLLTDDVQSMPPEISCGEQRDQTEQKLGGYMF